MSFQNYGFLSGGWIFFECALQIVKNNLFLILEPSGIFVKSITKSSAVEHDGRIQIGDQIIAVSITFNNNFVNFHG
jgi:hypothetical protein